MASFLKTSSGTPTVKMSSPRTKSDMLNVDNMYRILISNEAGTIKFSGYTPETLSFGLSSGWSAPFEGVSLLELGKQAVDSAANAAGGTISRVYKGMEPWADKFTKMAGMSSYHKLLSAQTWDSPGYLTLELPIFLDAYSSTMEEVVNPIVHLLSLAAPDEYQGLLIPPGPVPAVEVIKEALSNVSATALTSTTDFLDKAKNNAGLTSISDLKGKFNSKEAFTVTIGNFFSMSPAIIEGVSLNTENVFEDGTGKPVSADVMVSVKSYFAVTRPDLKDWFGVA